MAVEVLGVVVHMVGLGVVGSITRIMGSSGFLVDGWERWCLLLEGYVMSTRLR